MLDCIAIDPHYSHRLDPFRTRAPKVEGEASSSSPFLFTRSRLDLSLALEALTRCLVTRYIARTTSSVASPLWRRLLSSVSPFSCSSARLLLRNRSPREVLEVLHPTSPADGPLCALKPVRAARATDSARLESTALLELILLEAISLDTLLLSRSASPTT